MNVPSVQCDKVSSCVGMKGTPNMYVYWMFMFCISREDDEDGLNVTDFDERDLENVNLNSKRSGSAKKRKESYDYINTVQMLGKLAVGW